MIKPILPLLLEAGLLKRVKRSGWWVVGIDNPETVAEHSFRTSLIGYLLAKQEKANPYPVLMMTLFNDLHEARINDLHKMAQTYFLDFSKAEQKAFSQQIKKLPVNIRSELAKLQIEFVSQDSREAIISRDADILECLLQAKEYYEQGYSLAKNFFKQAPKHLKTKSAKELWRQIQRCKVDKWWQAVSTFKR